jgi:hypothetical protein
LKLIITKGATSVSVDVFIRDTSVTTGAGLIGLAYNTASLTAYYTRQNAAATAITLATQTATGAYSSGGFVAVDGTNMPGLYRLDIPDAVLASGVNQAYIMLKGAANMEVCVLEIELATIDLQAARVDANVTYFGGAAGTFASGRPEVNTTHFGGTAGTFASGRPEANATHFAGTAYATALAAEVDAVWDEAVDGSTTARQSCRLWNATLGGKASGLATTTAVYRDLADSKDRVSATVDANGNRTAVTRDLT